MQVKKSFTVFLIISFLNSSFFTIGCATSNYNAPEVKQEGKDNDMIYKSPGATVYKGPVTINNPPPEPSFWQNPRFWLWTVIVGGVGAAVYYSSQKKEDPKPTDQPTQGYIGINW